MVSEPKQHEWYGLLSLDYENKTFVVERVVLTADYSSAPRPHVIVSSPDEIGAYMETRRIVGRLGFEPEQE